VRCKIIFAWLLLSRFLRPTPPRRQIHIEPVLVSHYSWLEFSPMRGLHLALRRIRTEPDSCCGLVELGKGAAFGPFSSCSRFSVPLPWPALKIRVEDPRAKIQTKTTGFSIPRQLGF
jgi:hypothetical protein